MRLCGIYSSAELKVSERETFQQKTDKEGHHDSGNPSWQGRSQIFAWQDIDVLILHV